MADTCAAVAAATFGAAVINTRIRPLGVAVFAKPRSSKRGIVGDKAHVYVCVCCVSCRTQRPAAKLNAH